MMLTLTSPIETRLHRVSARVKLALLGVFTAVLFYLRSPELLGAALIFVAGVYLAVGGMPFLRQGVRLLRPLWPFVVLIGVWHIWSAERSIGAAIALRFLSAVAAANLVTMTTRLDAMIAAFEWALKPLKSVLPVHRLTLSVALVIRFIPVLSLRITQIDEALRARSPRPARWRVVMPAILAALDDAEQVSQALRARGGVE